MTHADVFMAHALRLAEHGLLTSAPNPAIGCVIVKDGLIIGEGFTQPPGGNHAEIEAINDARVKGHDVRGATAYVTLEPCSHFGRTPPCADALVKAGLVKVIAAMEDPNPQVGGQGFARLRAAGIAVETGVLAEQARELNIGFFSRMQSGKPWVRLKVAASLDGKTALYNGQSQWITSSAARDDGHLWRARAGVILTGIGTVKQDDPQLTVRALEVTRQPLRVIIDSKLGIDINARILRGEPTLIFSAIGNPEKEALLHERGAEVVVLPNAHGKVDLPQVILALGSRQINEIHVEAGAKLNASLIRELCVDELLVYLAPNIIGDARGMFDLPPLDNLQEKFSLKFHQIKQIGEDLRILARFN
ncbi:bifunctional diaminohydroxyphosphoribosylaminopyrimidine deaminase/5-amino-6-(5-phosphoribosylamino)uracil reductase RibD [Glaciimonas immobilis]|uniref:Riboflavin biosynthesis protein RibD n=1 Tax=Glaciimonas immobilis TaxID=728004 RepID=A0A840RXG1_9BURK|nr:bifunctional diaminohydroxyphosphoribosylaminopyrimidine deaminase/5-amino-6-(5-phosphoribosylamino)uracil reductase RibD [Glaciimonas immobilis]KAF3996081.1 bifunctional diaminohydroxyphosphoribosylaminopyrimidine deaminase/5-amino-6-(5-phosphoribosylamino)uracil reductase RibD [Glaciimonas immobilis]MBB5201778.1 diaminohydroxyphosphoribosylaminopyrimidine deaminase/5-amino-6-(5-phosphoribosylamino)uracil reductase [Glaciimonas immobilis]